MTAQLSLDTHRAHVLQTPVCSASHRQKNEGKPEMRPCPDTARQHPPGWGGEGSDAGDVPNRREIMLRFGGGTAAGGAGEAAAGGGACGCWASGAGTGENDGGGSGETVEPVASGCGGCGVPGLELPVDVELGGTMGDWEPEEGLCPLVVRGDVCPRLRASIISRKLQGR